MEEYNNIRKQSKRWSKVADCIVKFKQRATRGEVFVKDVHLFLVVIAMFTVRQIPLHTSIVYGVLSFIGLRLFHLGIGYWDEKKGLLWQRERAREARVYNPVTNKIDNIAKILNIKNVKAKLVYQDVPQCIAQKYKIFHWYILYRQRTDRGESYMSDFKSLMNYGVITGALFIPVYTLPFLVILSQLGFFFIGWFDETKLKLWQMEVARDMRVYNPVEVKLDKIEQKLKRMIK